MIVSTHRIWWLIAFKRLTFWCFELSPGFGNIALVKSWNRLYLGSLRAKLVLGRIWSRQRSIRSIKERAWNPFRNFMKETILKLNFCYNLLVTIVNVLTRTPWDKQLLSIKDEYLPLNNHINIPTKLFFFYQRNLLYFKFHRIRWKGGATQI